MRKINASYNDKIIRVYQAYNNEIADEAIKLGTFGNKFKKTRMTWIKPSFLWMMYRAGWGEKEGQERILGIDILIEGFIEILKSSVLSHYDRNVYNNEKEWINDKRTFLGRCQWDPERNISGEGLDYRAIQLGIKDDLVEDYINNWIIKIEDITPNVKKLKSMRNKSVDITSYLPVEKEFKVYDNEIIKKLRIDT